MLKLVRDSVVVILIVGCIGLAEPRAVNISNMWTLPQEGFSVFYRYFRDKISWLEADAVCQFHHANLVTVDNGVQFDATRAFLKELDVTNAVWIGLKRPENSERFTWTSSKTLDSASGYWADIIPAIEQPLCAVVDPVRDFRWHALRCGGPETAAFLCELPVPTWAVDCTVTSIPSLTVQYMSDSGTVQLSRDCGESGTKHISCQGKQDRNNIVEQLQCSEEENLASVATIDNGNQVQLTLGAQILPTASSTSRPQQQPILEHDILTVVSSIDQENNNKIEVNPNQIEDTVKNVINKFSLQDLMRSEQAGGLHNDELANAGHESKFERTSGYSKKYLPLHGKKTRFVTKKPARSNWSDGSNEEDDDDEMMMGDQPMQDETETQPIDIVQQAVKPTADGEYPNIAPVGYDGKQVNNEKGSSGDTSAAWTEVVTTPDSRSRRGTDADREEESNKTTTQMQDGTTFDVNKLTRTTIPDPNVITSTSPATTVTDVSPAVVTTKSKPPSHVQPTTSKMEVITGDHFIPPMLLVKARFISARPPTESPATTMLPYLSSTSVPVEASIGDGLPTTLTTSDATVSEDRQKNDSLSSVESTSIESIVDASPDKTLSVPTVAPSTTDLQQAVQVALEHRETTAEQIPTDGNDYPSQIAAVESTIHLTQSAELFTTTAASFEDTAVHISKRPKPNPVAISSLGKEIDDTSFTTDSQQVQDNSESSTLMSTVTVVPKSTMIPRPELNAFSNAVNPTAFADAHKSLQDSTDNHTFEQQAESDEQTKHTELHNSFSNVENYQPYKPNRHRTLTKPEVPFKPGYFSENGNSKFSHQKHTTS